jgi:hypothetical protein
VIAIIIGGMRATVGGHRAEGIMEMIFGVGLMAYAQQVVT